MCRELRDDSVGYYDIEACWEVERADRIIDSTRKNVGRVIDMLYSNSELRTSDLEDAIEEICNALDLTCPLGSPTIYRDGPKLFKFGVQLSKLGYQ